LYIRGNIRIIFEKKDENKLQKYFSENLKRDGRGEERKGITQRHMVFSNLGINSNL
jgi:hypothetical protein